MNAISQTALNQIWNSVNAGTGDYSDRFNKVVSDNNNHLIAAGYTIRQGNYRDFLVVKYDAAGNVVWVQTENGDGNGNDEVIDVACDFSGNVYVTGYADDGNSNNDYLTVKYDANGVKQWEMIYNNLSAFQDDVPTGIAVDFSGNVYVTGKSEAFSGTNIHNDYLTVMYSTSGAQQWTARYARVANGKDEAAGIALDASGNVFVTGRSSNGGDDDFATIKYNPSGVQQWAQIFDRGYGDDRATSLVVDVNNNVVVTGRAENSDGNDDYYTIKYNNNGILKWQKVYNGVGNDNDRALCIATDFDASIYITGQSDVDLSTSIRDYDIVTIKYDSSGVVQFTRTYGGGALQDDIPSDIAIDFSNNVYVTGKSDVDPSTTVTNNDFITVGYNAAGTQQWTAGLNGTRNTSDISSCILIDFSGNIYVAGGSENLVTQKDGMLIEYDNTGAVQFQQVYAGEGDNTYTFKDMVINSADEVYAVGYSFIEDHNRDIVLMKLNSSGGVANQKIFNGTKSDDDELESIALLGNGQVVATGYSKSTNQKSDIITMMFDANGDTLWTKKYNSAGNQSDKGKCVLSDASGNIYVAGTTDVDANDTLDNDNIILIKYDINGVQQWIQTYDGTAQLRDEPSKMKFDQVGNILICGRAEIGQGDDYIVLKYDVSGNLMSGFPVLFNGPFSNDDRALDVATDSQNNIYVTGYSQTSSGNATEDIGLIKYDAAGSLLWSKLFDNLSGNDRANAVAVDQNDFVYIAGQTDVDPDPNISNYNTLLIKYDPITGDTIWIRQFNGSANKDDIANDIFIDSNNLIYLVCSSEDSITNTQRNLRTLVYGDNGYLYYYADYGSSTDDDDGNDIKIANNALYICGYSENTSGEKRGLVLKYDINTGLIQSNKGSIETKIFPNPAIESLTLELNDFSSLKNVTVSIFDLQGKVQLVENVKSSSHKVQISNLSPGMYLLKINADNDNMQTVVFTKE